MGLYDLVFSCCRFDVLDLIWCVWCDFVVFGCVGLFWNLVFVEFVLVSGFSRLVGFGILI